jgi:hypothetical protein
VIEAAPALLAWLGASLVVLADGRRGLALGLAALTVGLALLAWPAGTLFGAGAVAAGGMVAAGRFWRSGPATWAIMPAGSTPRLVLCVASGVLALWVAASVTSGPGAPLRFTVLLVLGLMGARILMSRDLSVLLTSIAAFALALAVGSGLADPPPGVVPYIAGGLVAAGSMFVPAGQADHRTLGAPSKRTGKDEA